MGGCCRKCFSYKSHRTIPLILLGLDNAGKTEVAHRLFKIKRSEHLPTKGCKMYEVKGAGQRVSVSELGGGPNIRAIWKHYLLEAYGVIFVIDSTDMDRMEEARRTLRDLLAHPHLEGKPFLILANKQDLSGALDYVDIFYHFELNEMANAYRNPCMLEATGSGGDDKSLHTAFCWLLASIEQRRKVIRNLIGFHESHPLEQPLRPVTSFIKSTLRRQPRERPQTAPQLETRAPAPKPVPVPVIIMPTTIEEYSSDNPDSDMPDLSSRAVVTAEVHRADEKSPRLRVPSEQQNGYPRSNGKLSVSHSTSISGNGSVSSFSVPNSDLIVEDLSLDPIPNGNAL